MGNQIIELQAREQQLYKVLEDWPQAKAIMVGGYAASAWSFPRFSHDLDFVVPEEDTETLREHFTNHGLSLVGQRPEIEQNYGGAWERWEGRNQEITIDLLVNSIQDRDFQVPISFQELWRHHAIRPVRGLTQSGIELPVINKELLIALKCQPMRPRDIGDICSIAYVGYNAATLQQLLKPIIAAEPEMLQQRITRLRQTIGTTLESLQHALGPRIPQFHRIRNDMQRTIDALIAQMERWSTK